MGIKTHAIKSLTIPNCLLWEKGVPIHLNNLEITLPMMLRAIFLGMIFKSLMYF